MSDQVGVLKAATSLNHPRGYLLGPGEVTTEEVLAAEADLSVDYVAVADLDGPTLAAAVRVGATRLIDNVRLDD